MLKIINGVSVELSEDEITEKEAREQEHLIKIPLFDWQRIMDKSDTDLPRWAEDLFDLATGTKQLADLPELAAKIADKKTLRGSKP